MKIFDKRKRLQSHRSKTYQQRRKTSIRYIAIHHSATMSGSAEAFARYHVSELGWPGIGYHYVVDQTGNVSMCHDVEVVSYHVGNNNHFAVGICIVGDFTKERLQEKQEQTAIEMTKRLMNELNIPVKNVLGHNEFRGTHSTHCPAINMDQFRNKLFNHPRQRLLFLQTPFIRGADVKQVQRALNVVMDGIYGPQTEKAVRNFQKKERLAVDGIVGPETRGCLF